MPETGYVRPSTINHKNNAATEGAGVPIRTFRKNCAFSVRDIEAKAELIDCGAEPASKADAERASL